MRELLLDGCGWKISDDVYSAFFAAVNAPSWHGRNFNALVDSIETGDINAIEVPYRIVFKNFDLIQEEAKRTATDFVDLILEIAERGCPVEIELHNSHGAKLPVQ